MRSKCHYAGLNIRNRKLEIAIGVNAAGTPVQRPVWKRRMKELVEHQELLMKQRVKGKYVNIYKKKIVQKEDVN